MHMRHSSSSFLLLLLLVLSTFCFFHQATASAHVKSFWVNGRETSRLTNYPNTLPGETDVEVEIWLYNRGNQAWPANAKVVLQANDDGWTGGGDFEGNATDTIETGDEARFEGTLNAPADTIGIFTLSFEVVNADGSDIVSGGVTFTIDIEATCDDRIFCNGHEVWANGTCVASNTDPCIIADPQNCVHATCNETTDRCNYTLDAGCETCAGCVPDCNGKQCGSDGCGGVCGQCESQYGCVDGTCAVVADPGTCGDPFPFFEDGVEIEGRHWLEGDTSTGVHHVTPECNEGSSAKELIYYIEIPAGGPDYGMMAQYYGFDTVLDVREGDCFGESVACNDDAYPPGDYGSRVQVLLEAGKHYYLVLDAYNEENPGPFTLFADFYPNCIPRCNSLYCGDNGCGGDCGPCPDGQECSDNNKCFPIGCVANCTGKSCGDDGCGGECGTCTSPSLCARGLGQCLTYASCDHFRPSCDPECGEDQFCGTDCQCYNVTEPLPDLILNPAKLAEQVRIQTLDFAASDCAVQEGCIQHAGSRRVLRFTVESANQGQATLLLGDPALRPDLFSYSSCHGHYHFDGYTTYQLISKEPPYDSVVLGRKQGYCIYDAYRFLHGPAFECTTEQTCSAQGIQPGWVDNYGWSLDCQWIDITDVEPGDYYLFVEINYQRRIQESNYDNNKVYVPVTVSSTSGAAILGNWLFELVSSWH